MANSIKSKTNSTKTKELKVKDKNDVEKVISNNKTTVVTGNKSNAVRKKPVVTKTTSTKAKSTKTKTKKAVVEVKKDEEKNIKSIKVDKIDNIKEKAEKAKENKEIKVAFPREEKVDTPVIEEVKTIDKKVQLNKNKVKMPKNRKLAKASIKNNSKKKSTKPLKEKNVKSVIKPKEEEKTVEKPIVIEKEENAEIKSIKVDKVDNIKKRAIDKNKEKKKVAPIKTGKRVKSVYDPELNKWVVKEDKSKPVTKPVKGKKKLQNISPEDDYTYELETGGLKSKFFEEVNVEKYNEVRRTKRRKYPKRILIAVIILAILGGTGFILYKQYKQEIKRRLNMYEVYNLGQEVKLADDSIWYVVEKSDGSKGDVILLSKTLVDVNEDGIIDGNDYKQYSSGKVEYDPLDESSIAYYLENEYKPKLVNKVGKIENISLMSSKQFVGLRQGMGYGYEWGDNNILSSDETNSYFLSTNQNGKIYVVRRNGTYTMMSPTSSIFMRVVITVDKSIIKKD